MNNLIRSTTYYYDDLLEMAKRRALSEKRNLYEIFNEALRYYLHSEPNQVRAGNKPIVLEDLIGKPHNLGLKKKKLTRKDYYDLSRL